MNNKSVTLGLLVVLLLGLGFGSVFFPRTVTHTLTSTTTIPTTQTTTSTTTSTATSTTTVLVSSSSYGAVTEELITEEIVTPFCGVSATATTTQTLYLLSSSQPGSLTPEVTTTLTFTNMNTSTLPNTVTTSSGETCA